MMMSLPQDLDQEADGSEVDDDLDLEFMLYSQLHYEPADSVDLNKESPAETSHVFSDMVVDVSGLTRKNITTSESVKNTSTPTYAFPDDALQHLMYRDDGEKSNFKRKRTPSPKSSLSVKKKKKDKSCIEKMIVISSDTSTSDSSVVEMKYESLKSRRKKSVKVHQDSVLEPSTSIISISSEASDSSASSETSASHCEDVDSASSSIDGQTLRVHMNSNQAGNKLSSKDRTEEHDEKWKINEEDRLAAIEGSPGGKRFGGTGQGGRYYRPSSVKCFNCKEVGHLSKDCQKPKKSQICFLCGRTGHFFRDCPQSICYRCNRPAGHTAVTCSETKQWRYEQCHRCGMRGHPNQDCPDRWRQFHMTTSTSRPCPVVPEEDKTNQNINMSCYNCASKNHFGHECPLERVDRYSQATYPMIARYDKWNFLRQFFISGYAIKKKELKEKRKLKKQEKKSKITNSVPKPIHFIKELKSEMMTNPHGTKQNKKKRKHHWRDKFFNFADSGKPVKTDKKKRRKAEKWKSKQNQREVNASGFWLSAAAHAAQMKLHR